MQAILKKSFGTAAISCGAIMVAFVLCSIMLILQGINPIDAFSAIVYGAVGNVYSIFSSVTAAVPLALAALGYIISFRAGVYNIGIEGQLFIGALFSTIIGTNFSFLPIFIHLPISLLAGMAGGMLWALFPALMKRKRGFNEVITTVLMNYIGIYVVNFAVGNPLRPEGVFVNQSAPILPSATLTRFSQQYELNYGLILLVLVAIGSAFLLNRTTWGYRICVVGQNPCAATTFGINAESIAFITFLISGALAGLGGSVEVLGNQGILAENFAVNMGYNAIAVALLGGVSVPGAMLAALFMGCLRNGGIMLQIKMGISSTLMNMIQAILILTVLCFTAVKLTPRSSRRKAGNNHA